MTDLHPPATARPVPLRGRRVRLVVPGPSLVEAMYVLTVSEEVGFRWRFHGRAVGPDEFAATLWNDVLTQHVAVRVADGAPVAWLAAYSPNLRDGHARVAVAAWPDFHGRLSTWEAVYLFLGHVFGTWPFRKVYAEVRAFNLEQFGSGAGRMFDVEGVLRDHTYHDGRYWDQHLLALTRDRFDLLAARYSALFEPAGGGGA